MTVIVVSVWGIVSLSGSPYVESQEPFRLENYAQITPENLSEVTQIYQLSPTAEDTGITYSPIFSSNFQWFAYSHGSKLKLINIRDWRYHLQAESCSGDLVFDYHSQHLISACSYEIHRWELSGDFRRFSFETGTPPSEELTSPMDVQVFRGNEEIVTVYGARGGIKRWAYDGELIEETDYGFGPDLPTVQNSVLSPNGDLHVYVLMDAPNRGGSSLHMRQVSPFEIIADLTFLDIVDAESVFIGAVAVDITSTVVVNLDVNREGEIIVFVSGIGTRGTYFMHDINIVTTIEYSAPDVLAVGTGSGEIYIMQAQQSYPTLYRLEGHTARITDLAFAPGRGALVSTSEDGTVRFWGIAE
jgi:WD40 repeat protein